ncbi:MAG: hypothetical protein V7764_19695 [Pseudomonas marincola]|jgi:hypothetical protein|uniref:hypothetical protein n=1 Tax=Pseudomonas marincola TaxID=437900 RepID=UPI00300267A9
MTDVLAFLFTLRELHPDLPRFALNGGCFKVYLVLKQAFPQAEPYYNGDHVITRIDGDYYDIRGQVEPVSDCGPYMRMDPLCFNRAYGWNNPALVGGESIQAVAHG